MLVNAVRLLFVLSLVPFVAAQEGPTMSARARYERLNQIRQDKFDYVLPQAMRDNGIDLWITMIREANYGTLHGDLGFGYAGTTGYYVFYDEGGERVERVAFGISGHAIENAGVYDAFKSVDELGAFVRERKPERIGVNTSRAIGPADTLSHTGYEELVEILGPSYAERLVSAEKLISDFRATRVASELAAFAEAGELSRRIAERALSNEVITPGATTLEDVAWWMQDELLERGLGSSFGMPSVYVTGAEGIAAVSTPRIIQRGDLLNIDWGVGFLGFFTDMKRIAYVLRPGETAAPAGLQFAFDRAVAARAVVAGTIRAGRSAVQAEAEVYAALKAAGFVQIEFNQPTANPETTDVVIGCHSVGNSGHGIGPSIAFFNPVRRKYELRASNLLSIELFAYTALPEWDGAKVRIALEDDATLTERGVEWLYPVCNRILLVR